MADPHSPSDAAAPSPLNELAALVSPDHSPRPGRRPPHECGPLGLRIAADGTWFYQDSPIGRKELVKLFATVLSRDENGVYWMTTPAEHGTVEVDDKPFLIVEMVIEGTPGPEQTLRLRTNLDDWITLDQDHPLRVHEAPHTGEPDPTVYIRKGMEAKIGRAVFYEMVEIAVSAPKGSAAENDSSTKDVIGLWSMGQFFPLGSI